MWVWRMLEVFVFVFEKQKQNNKNKPPNNVFIFTLFIPET